jgi:uncharacterized protein YjbI with pentapeptide repeats
MRGARQIAYVLDSLTALAVICAVSLPVAAEDGKTPRIPSQLEEELIDAQRANANAQAEYYRLQAAKLRERPPETSFLTNLAENPAAALSAAVAMIAALVTFTTFFFNYRASIRNQRDTQFYEALKRFGDQSSPVLRSSAAGLLGQMADWRTNFQYPYYATALDQLSMGLLLEEDAFVRAANGRAIQCLITVNARSVIESLRGINVRLQGELVRLLVTRASMQQEASWESVGENITGYKRAVLQALMAAHAADTDAFSVALPQDQQPSAIERHQFVRECDAQLRAKAQLLRENCALLQWAVHRILPGLTVVTRLTKKGYVTKYKPERHAHFHPPLVLERVFLPNADFRHRFLQRAVFSNCILPKADFKGAFLLDCSFDEATLHHADFSTSARLQSSRFRISIRRSFIDSPTSFRDAQLQDADFRGAQLVKVVMRSANMTGAKLFGASIIDEGPWAWEEANWWEADFSRGSFSTFDPEGDASRTRATFALLYKKYKGALAEEESGIHPSVQELRATFASANGS